MMSNLKCTLLNLDGIYTSKSVLQVEVGAVSATPSQMTGSD